MPGSAGRGRDHRARSARMLATAPPATARRRRPDRAPKDAGSRPATRRRLGGRPRTTTSPPALTQKHDAPASRSISLTRATAQPFTNPEGRAVRAVRGATIAWGHERDVERSAALPSHLVAESKHDAYVGARILDGALAAADPHDLGLRTPGAEQVVDALEPREARVDDVLDDRSRTSTLITVPHSSSTRRTGCVESARARSSALCSDCA